MSSSTLMIMLRLYISELSSSLSMSRATSVGCTAGISAVVLSVLLARKSMPGKGSQVAAPTHGREVDVAIAEKGPVAVSSRESVPAKQALVTAGLMALNFVTAVGIVVLNKALFQRGFNFATFMTGMHFVATTIGVRICQAVGVYSVKPLRRGSVLPITISFCSFVVFNNLSLQYNSIGFYQLMKVLTTPCVVILQLLLFGVSLPIPLALALVPVCIGVGMATVREVSFNAVGLFWAVAGLMAAAFYQLLVKKQQNALNVSSLQLLHYQAPQAAVLCLLCAPFLHDWTALTAALASRDPMLLPALGLSCLLAFGVNLSTFLVIQHTSPVSYQVLGHFKLLVILSAGVAALGEDADPERLAGMALAFLGIVTYTSLKQGLASGWG